MLPPPPGAQSGDIVGTLLSGENITITNGVLNGGVVSGLTLAVTSGTGVPSLFALQEGTASASQQVFSASFVLQGPGLGLPALTDLVVTLTSQSSFPALSPANPVLISVATLDADPVPVPAAALLFAPVLLFLRRRISCSSA
ncbi:hypothetical protein [Parvularcula maris]|uniref:Uncharacterized protein n=1 Tax=Parvularcula maris TaxID=2965077 RepID=A0A9X2LB50_9PROT|nr:hypothetical protein [Parvularcula maris]MCQ8186311.1 hypothetical protein [Parvularcula maris]